MEIWAETLRNEKLAEITRGGRSLRQQWLESLIRGAVQEGVYSKEVDPRGLANLIMSIFDGLRLGRLLWRDDFDLDGAVQALTLMTTGRVAGRGWKLLARSRNHFIDVMHLKSCVIFRRESPPVKRFDAKREHYIASAHY